MTQPRVACVIPSLNAAPTLAGVVDGLRRALPESRVIVIDDGSTDDTHVVAARVADFVVRFPRNRGKGAALRAGFAAAGAGGANRLLTVDADGQHDPERAPALISALDAADIVIGARDRRSSAMPAARRLTNRLSAAAVGRCIGRPVADAQSGYRAIRAHVISAVAPRGDRYEFETEFLILAARQGFQITFVPVPTRYPQLVPSQFRLVRDSARIVGTLWRFGIGAAH
ncbi:MAG TPA: glycosyltransferase family 2 protein [Gemmatimonadaceae bacterium]|nr:glycosyltransferase family 2 protein [Gemmatimonadaceae bacterium]